jgi:hypothetical protein
MATNMERNDARRPNRWRVPVWGAAACLLLLPAVAMQFDTGVNWTGSDFVVFGTMLFVACCIHELGALMSGSTLYRAAFAIAIATGFFMVWVNLAVGIIGSEHNPANLAFAGVLVVAVIGALAARFRATGMARAMVATAIAQALVVGIAAMERSIEGVALSVCFTAAWLASAALFRKAARQ